MQIDVAFSISDGLIKKYKERMVHEPDRPAMGQTFAGSVFKRKDICRFACFPFELCWAFHRILPIEGHCLVDGCLPMPGSPFRIVAVGIKTSVRHQPPAVGIELESAVIRLVVRRNGFRRIVHGHVDLVCAPVVAKGVHACVMKCMAGLRWQILLVQICKGSVFGVLK